MGLLQALKTHPNSAMIHENGLCLLAGLGYENTLGFPIMEMGGIEATLGAMEQFPTQEALQSNGLHVLDNELFDNADKARATRFDNANGISILLTAARNHRHCLEIQQWACHVMSRVAAFGDHTLRRKLKQTALSTMTKSIEFHPDDEELAAAVKALVNDLL